MPLSQFCVADLQSLGRCQAGCVAQEVSMVVTLDGGGPPDDEGF